MFTDNFMSLRKVHARTFSLGLRKYMIFQTVCLRQHLRSSYTAGKQPESRNTSVVSSVYLEYLHFHVPLSLCVSDYGCDMDDDDGY